MLVNTELVAAVLISFVWARISPYFSLPHKMLLGVRFWTAPPEAEIERLLPKPHKRLKQKTIDLRAERLTAMPVQVEKMIDRNQHPIKDGMLGQLLQYSHLDTVLFVGVIVATLFLFSGGRSCLRGVSPDLVSSYGLFSVYIVCLHSLSYVMLRVGLGSTELRLSMLVGFFSFVIALGCLFLPPRIMDYDLEAGLAATAKSTEAILKQMNITAQMKPSPTALRLVLAAFGGVIGGLTALPAFRFARCYYDITVTHMKGFMLRTLLHINFFAPLLVAVSFIKPLTADILLPSNLVACEEGAPSRDCVREGQTLSGGVFSTESQWLGLRVLFVILVGALRISVVRPFIQSYLSISKDKAVENVVERVGSIGNPTADDVQLIKKVITNTCHNIYQYICVATLHLVSPAIMLITLGLMLHRLGEVELGVCNAVGWGMDMAGLGADAFKAVGTPKPSALQTAMESGLKSMLGSEISLASVQVLPAPMMRAAGSFLVWWSCCVWFVVTSLGVIYWRMRFAGTLGGRPGDDDDDSDDEAEQKPTETKKGKKGKKGKKKKDKKAKSE